MPDRPRYRIHSVAEMTGVPASTLRAWERRYGIPTPQRTSSSYRLYTEDDVAQVRRLRDLCCGGMAPAEAAAVLTGTEPEATRLAACPYAEACRRLVEAVRAWDPRALRLELARATYLGSAVNVFDHVLGPVLRAVGELWCSGELDTAREHLATEQILGTARDLHRLSQPDGGRLLLLAAAAGERHVAALYHVAIRFAGWGFRSEILGADTPPDALACAVRAMEPVAVGLSMTVPPAEPAGLLDAIAEACAGRPWMIGGAAAEHLAGAIRARGGIACAELAAVRAELERALAPAPREQTA